MRFFTNLLFKVTLSSMVLTAPAMINGNHNYVHNGNPRPEKETTQSFYSSAVIRKYIDRPTLVVRTVAALATPVFAAARAADVAIPPGAAAATPVPEPLPAEVHAPDMAAAKAAELR